MSTVCVLVERSVDLFSQMVSAFVLLNRDRCAANDLLLLHSTGNDFMGKSHLKEIAFFKLFISIYH